MRKAPKMYGSASEKGTNDEENVEENLWLAKWKINKNKNVENVQK